MPETPKRPRFRRRNDKWTETQRCVETILDMRHHNTLMRDWVTQVQADMQSISESAPAQSDALLASAGEVASELERFWSALEAINNAPPRIDLTTVTFADTKDPQKNHPALDIIKQAAQGDGPLHTAVKIYRQATTQSDDAAKNAEWRSKMAALGELQVETGKLMDKATATIQESGPPKHRKGYFRT